MTQWWELFSQARGAFFQERTFDRARMLGLSSIAGLGRKTISQMLCACGLQQSDWSASYRLFEKERFDPEVLWSTLRRSVFEALGEKSPVVVLMDDTLTRRKGKKVAGASWRKDPLGPRFSDNFVWANRFLQLSLALPKDDRIGSSPARAIPADLLHCPTPRKPNRRASEEEWRTYRAAMKTSSISAHALLRMQAMRENLDREGGRERKLWFAADANFTNGIILKHLPPRTVLIGRIRKDAHLFALPLEQTRGKGRKLCYGESLPTPEEMRCDQAIPWQTLRAFAAGKTHDFNVKIISPVRWKSAGGDLNLKLLIIRPLRYRLSKNKRLYYRDPSYLICSDPSLSDEEILQAYLWRWEIEVNFRDEKTLIGLGQAQVRTASAVEAVATFVVFCYALLLLATDRNHLLHEPLPRPVWQRSASRVTPERITTAQSISLLRAELWFGNVPHFNKTGFASQPYPKLKLVNMQNSLGSAVCFASK